MRDGRELEQLFVRRRGGRIELLLVLEDPAGGRHREIVPLPHADPSAAVTALGRLLARRGDVVDAPRLRIREERARTLIERPDLVPVFLEAFEAELEGDG